MSRLIALFLGSLLCWHQAFAVMMSEDTKLSGRVFLNTESMQGPTFEREKRYGLVLGLKGHFPIDGNGWENRLGYFLLADLAPDLQRRSGEVNINQDFFSISPLASYSYVAWFRFSWMLGPGLLWSLSRYNVLGDSDTRSQFSLIASAGFMLDYAIDEVWEITWMIRTQYRWIHEKWDWQYGFGAAYNF